MVIALIGISAVIIRTPSSAKANIPWNDGDIFAGVANGHYKIYDSNGNNKQEISDDLPSVPSWGDFTDGCSFNPAKTQLYTTNWSNGKIVVYNTADPHTIASTVDLGQQIAGSHGESIVFAANGDYYVGLSDGSKQIMRYNANDVFQQAYNVVKENRGADWMDLASDQKTIYYDSEGRRIMRYDASTGTQLPDFVTLPGSFDAQHTAFALRLLAPGDGSGGLIVADSGNIKQLDSKGNIIQTYSAPNQPKNFSWFALNLDPDGIHFWSADYYSLHVYEFEFGNPNPIKEIDASEPGGTLAGICMKGEITAAIPSIEFNKTVDKTVAHPGDTLAYTLSYKNTGTDSAYNVVIKDPLPPNVTYLSSPDNPVVTPNNITFNVGAIPAGEGGSVSFTVTTTKNSVDTLVTNMATLDATRLPAPVTSTAKTRMTFNKLRFDSDAWIGNSSITTGDHVEIANNTLAVAGRTISSGNWMGIPNYNGPGSGAGSWDNAENQLSEAARNAYMTTNEELPADEQFCPGGSRHLLTIYFKHGIDPFTGAPIANYAPNAGSKDPYILFQFNDNLDSQGCSFIIDKNTTIYGTGTIVTTNRNALLNWQPGDILPGGTWQIQGEPTFANPNDTLGILNFGNNAGQENSPQEYVEIGSGVSLKNTAIFSGSMLIDANTSDNPEYLSMNAMARHMIFPKGGDLNADIHFQNSGAVASNIPPLFQNLTLPFGGEKP